MCVPLCEARGGKINVQQTDTDRQTDRQTNQLTYGKVHMQEGAANNIFEYYYLIHSLYAYYPPLYRTSF